MDREPKSWIMKFLEASVMFVIAAYLIKLGVRFISQVWPVIVIIATLILTGIVIYRLWKRKNDTKW